MIACRHVEPLFVRNNYYSTNIYSDSDIFIFHFVQYIFLVLNQKTVNIACFPMNLLPIKYRPQTDTINKIKNTQRINQ